ncbi:MAG: hypothetical protein VX822_05940 [Candidatus Neomarinimicrobiota bacterium]|nr:hypothetical protein [Candidatus Neomarinimicrobiota bacterium]
MSPIVPLWLLLVVAASMVMLSVWSYRIGRSADQKAQRILSLFRLSSFLLIALIAANIQWTRKGSISKRPVVKVFFDNSLSSAYHQSVSKESLLYGYEELLRSIRMLTNNDRTEARVDAFTFGESVESFYGSPLTMNLDEASTNLSYVLLAATETTANERLGAVIVVTDGQTTVGTIPSGQLSIKVPVHTVGIGESMRMVDIRVSDVQVPTMVVKDENILAEITIESFGGINERVHVSLERGGKLIGTQVISPGGDGSSQIVRFQFQADEIGQEDYELRISSLKDEVNIDNNRFPFSLTVLKDRFKVAMITGVPSFNSRFLKLALAEEEDIQVDHFTRVFDEWRPSIADFWRQSYDLIILDNFPVDTTPERWPLNLNLKLRRENTAIAFIAGGEVSQSKLDPFLPLLGMQSIGEGDRGFGAIPLESALAPHDPMSYFDFDWSSLPPLSPHLHIEPGEKGMETAVQFSETPGIPLLVVGNIDSPTGEGGTSRRAVFTSAYLWHLYFRGQGADVNKNVLTYWTELLKWLTATGGEDDRYFRITKSLYQRGEEVSVEGTFSRLTEDQKRAGVWWRIEHSEMGESLIPLNLEEEGEMWRGSFIAAEPGKYRYWALVGDEQYETGEPQGEFRIEQAMLELKNVSLNRELLETISKSTGGRYFPWSEKDKITANLAFSEEEVQYSQALNLSHWFPLLIFLLMLLAAEWILRRTRGFQ